MTDSNASAASAYDSVHPKRLLRNYIINARFQLKYTGMVVLVTVVVAAVLGYLAYDYSRAQTEVFTMGRAAAEGIDAETMRFIREEAQAEDRKVLLGIVGGILVLAIALGITGILVTHRVVGPVHKMKRMLRRVARGDLNPGGKLRKHDELQDLFLTFETMVVELRARQSEEIAQLDAIIGAARKAGSSPPLVEELTAFRERMQRALD